MPPFAPDRLRGARASYARAVSDDAGVRRRPAAPTIYDVARACGVAPSTVSRAFSRPGRVNADTARRIHEAAERLGYRTNPLARALPTGRTSLLAVVVSDVTNPFFFDILRGAEAVAVKAGYTLLVADVHESGEAERNAVDRTVPLVEGVALATARMSHSAIRVGARERPTVVLNRVLPDIPSIVTDNADGARQLVRHLVSLGHTSLTYVGGPEASWANGMRWRAVLETATDAGVRVRQAGAFPPTQAGGLAAAQVVAAEDATAAIAYNDLMAIGLMRGLTRLGLDVPGDRSVTGFDNIFGSDFCTPPLTTVAAPLRQLGALAAQTLLDALGTGTPSRPAPGAPTTPVVLPVQLIVRDSTSAPR